MLEALAQYVPQTEFDIRLVSTQTIRHATVQDFTYAGLGGSRRAAYLVRPEKGEGPFPTVLYVHWYEPESPDSNRTQFLEEGIDMAEKGCLSLLIETMWSDRDWFIKRTQAEDWQNSVTQVMELRQAADLLLSQPHVDPQRFIYVGHDFGAMYGVLLGAADPRPCAYVLMAGTPRFPDWYLYYPAMEEKARQKFIQTFSPADPVTLVPHLAPAPILFQFGDHDPHVPIARGEAFAKAAKDPKKVRWYHAGHALNSEAAADRTAWICARLEDAG